jgi:hypothetical protein
MAIEQNITMANVQYTNLKASPLPPALTSPAAQQIGGSADCCSVEAVDDSSFVARLVCKGSLSGTWRPRRDRPRRLKASLVVANRPNKCIAGFLIFL